MRKRLFITIILFVICTFSYLQSSNKVLSKENIFYITITNNCNEEIYGIHYENKHNQRLDVGSIVHANGTMINAGEVLTLLFTSSDFYDDDLTEMTIEFFVILEGANEITCGVPIKLIIESEETYSFTLSGDKVNGFKVELR